MSKKKTAVDYGRVSTHKQGQEGESLEDQIAAAQRKADSLDAKRLKSFSEIGSGKSIHNRPQLQELFQYVEKNDIDYVIIRDIDRSTRGGSGDYMKIKKTIEGFGAQLVDTYGIIQPSQNTLEHFGLDYNDYDWANYSPSEAAERLKADAAKDERRTILNRLIPAEIKLVQQGYYAGGHVNYGFRVGKVFVDGKQRAIFEQCPDEAPHIYEMFQMRANGYSDQEIVDAVNKMGYRSKIKRRFNKERTKIIGTTGGNILDIKALQKMIARPVYAGITIHRYTNYNPIYSKGNSIVDIETFNRANNGKVFIKENLDGSLDMLYNNDPVKNVKRRMKDNPLYPIKSIVLCPECGSPFKGSASTSKNKKRHPAYHCERGHKRVSTKKAEFEARYFKALEKISFEGANDQRLESHLKSAWSDHVKQSGLASERHSEHVRELESEKERIVEKIIATDNQTVSEALEKKLETIDDEIKNSKNDLREAKVSEGDIDELLAFAKTVVEHPAKTMQLAEDFEVREALSEIYFKETPTYTEIVSGTPQMSVIFSLYEASRSEKSLNVEQCVTNWKQYVISLKKIHSILEC